MKTWPLTAWHHSFKQLLCYDIISWCKSYHPVKHATHDTAPGEVGGTRWMTHLAWCSQTPVRAKHYTAPWAYICDYNLVSIPSPKIIWTGLSYQILLINVLFPFSLFLHVQSMVVMVRADCIHVICFITIFSIQYHIIFPKGCAIERHCTSHSNKRN